MLSAMIANFAPCFCELIDLVVNVQSPRVEITILLATFSDPSY